MLPCVFFSHQDLEDLEKELKAKLSNADLLGTGDSEYIALVEVERKEREFSEQLVGHVRELWGPWGEPSCGRRADSQQNGGCMGTGVAGGMGGSRDGSPAGWKANPMEHVGCVAPLLWGGPSHGPRADCHGQGVPPDLERQRKAINESPSFNSRLMLLLFKTQFPVPPVALGDTAGPWDRAAAAGFSNPKPHSRKAWFGVQRCWLLRNSSCLLCVFPHHTHAHTHTQTRKPHHLFFARHHARPWRFKRPFRASHP